MILQFSVTKRDSSLTQVTRLEVCFKQKTNFGNNFKVQQEKQETWEQEIFWDFYLGVNIS